MIEIACDGSSLRNGDPETPIGWSWARDDGAWMSNGMIGGSNNRGELHAILSILSSHPKGELKVLMDSQYAMNIAEKWGFAWEKRGWRKADKKPIQNLDLVKRIVHLRHRRVDPVTFQWVKAHRANSHPLNIRADELCGEAARRAQAQGLKGQMYYLDSKGRTTFPTEERIFSNLYLKP